MSDKVRVGVVGAGVWAQVSHIPNLLKRADEGVYEAKARGRNQVIARAA